MSNKPSLSKLQPASAVPAGRHRTEGFRRWAVNDTQYYGCRDTRDALEPGVYRACASQEQGCYLDLQIVSTDDLMILPDTASDAVLQTISQFWDMKPLFVERGFIHKRGILMWGDPGSGKTATIQLIVAEIVRRGCIAIMGDDPRVLAGCLQLVRKIQPDLQIVVFLEDFDALVKQHGESEYLALLDGESQVDNIVFVATTNYPETLDKRFIDRPSRFDEVIHVPFPSAKARRQFLSTKEPSLTPEELDEWVPRTKGFSIAHLKEIIISVRCYGRKLDDVIARMDKMNKRDLNSNDARGGKTGIGFVKGENGGVLD